MAPNDRRLLKLDLPRWTSELYFPVLAAVAYYAAAVSAFLIGTLSDRIFAPFWPPNVVLLCALLLSLYSRWLLYLAVIFVGHAIAEAGIGMPFWQMLLAYATNCSVAIIGAVLLRVFVANPPWLGSLRDAILFVLVTAGIAPAIAAFGGAFVPIAGGGSIDQYWAYWGHWYVANALASLTLGPIVLSWFGERDHDWLLQPARWSWEAIASAAALVVSCALAVNLASFVQASFFPALLFMPLPVVLWMTFRFGVRGASAAILAVTVVLVSHTLQGSSPLAANDTETNVLALQLLLTGLSIPILLLGAAVDQAAAIQAATRWLAGSILKAQDQERREVARELHDNTGQNLVAATLLVSKLQNAPAASSEACTRLTELLQQSIANLRSMSYVLHPPLLDEAGLPLALRSYIGGFCARSGIRVDIELQDDIERLPPDIELVLFRVIEEALSNISRHTDSRNARILLSREVEAGRTSVVLTIENGHRHATGFPAVMSRLMRRGRLDPLQGVGLASVRERLHQVGGVLELHSAAGLTFVRAIVPLALEQTSSLRVSGPPNQVIA